MFCMRQEEISGLSFLFRLKQVLPILHIKDALIVRQAQFGIFVNTRCGPCRHGVGTVMRVKRH